MTSSIAEPTSARSQLSTRKFLLLPLLFLAAASAYGQSDSILPGPKPPDAPPEWKQLVGIYTRTDTKDSFIILERNRVLFLRDSRSKEEQVSEKDGILWLPDVPRAIFGHAENRNADGIVTSLSYGNELRARSDAGADPSHFYRVTPARPLADLRREAIAATPPVEKGPFRQPDLVELASLDPAIHLDVRYATTNNFLGVPVYTQARAFLQRPAAEALLRVLHKLQPLGYGLLIHDGYRPWYVTKIFWDATPPEGKIFVADPAQGSRHNRGCAVDLTLYDLKTGAPVEMPGTYDEMSPRSYPNYAGGTSLQRWHRDLLRRAMESEGFTVYEYEWWHFDYKDWREYPILNTPFEQLSTAVQEPDSFAARIQKIMDRPEFARANFGIEFYDIASGKVVYSHNADKMFVPASTTKTLSEGTLLATLGPDFRFHTKIYRTGPIDKKGRLKGDLILIASGDPNLSNRIQPDGTLAFQDEDHSYGGPAVAGDPLAVIRQLAKDVAAKGIRRIDGRVLIDTSLAPDGPREGGTNVVLSSIMVNDNVIDLTGAPAASAGEPVRLQISPQTSYARFVNHLVTSAAGSKPTLEDPEFTQNPDGTVTITLTGSLPLGMEPQTASVGVPSPTLFAETVFREALTASGIELKSPLVTAQPDFAPLSASYTSENLVAEHVSLPLSEEIKVTLKVSQNLHASMTPYLLGAISAKDPTNALKKGFEIERQFLQQAGLDLSGASQGDGAGGDWADLFSPDFMCRYLAYWTTRPDFDIFFRALPILGKDGTLAKIQKDSPAAGHVFAKTGTYDSEDRLNGKLMLNAKGLAGYVITQSGRKLAFAAYVNHVSLPLDPSAPQNIAGQALGAIAASAYDAPL